MSSRKGKHFCSSRRNCCLAHTNDMSFFEIFALCLSHYRGSGHQRFGGESQVTAELSDGLSLVYRKMNATDENLFICGNLCWNAIHMHFKQFLKNEGHEWGLTRGFLITTETNEKHFVWDLTFASDNDKEDADRNLAGGLVWFLIPKAHGEICAQFLRTVLGLYVYKATSFELFGLDSFKSECVLHLPRKQSTLHFVHINHGAARFMSNIQSTTVHPEEFKKWLHSILIVDNTMAICNTHRLLPIKCEDIPNAHNPVQSQQWRETGRITDSRSSTSEEGSSTNNSSEIEVDELDLSSLKQDVSEEEESETSSSTTIRYDHRCVNNLRDKAFEYSRDVDKDTEHFVNVLSEFSGFCCDEHFSFLRRECFSVKVFRCPICSASFTRDNTRLFRLVCHVLEAHPSVKSRVLTGIRMRNRRMFRKIQVLLCEIKRSQQRMSVKSS